MFNDFMLTCTLISTYRVLAVHDHWTGKGGSPWVVWWYLLNCIKLLFIPIDGQPQQEVALRRCYFQSMVSNLVIPLLRRVKVSKKSNKKKRTREDGGGEDDDVADAADDAAAAAAGDADADAAADAAGGSKWEKRIVAWFNETRTTSQQGGRDDDKQGMGPVVGGSKDLFQEHKEPQKVVSPEDLELAMKK
jgi:hypothetical protein